MNLDVLLLIATGFGIGYIVGGTKKEENMEREFLEDKIYLNNFYEMDREDQIKEFNKK